MEGLHRFLEYIHPFLDSAGIIGGLVFTGIAIRIEAKARRVGNILTITSSHRDIWKELFEKPELRRILEPAVNLKKHPPSPAEELFVKFVILHVESVFRAIVADEVLKTDGTDADVKHFFSLPIPGFIWDTLRQFQDRDFVKWVESLQTSRV